MKYGVLIWSEHELDQDNSFGDLQKAESGYDQVKIAKGEGKQLVKYSKTDDDHEILKEEWLE